MKRFFRFDGPAKAVFADMLGYLPAKLIPPVIAFFAIPVVTRLFDPEAYGDYVLVQSTILMSYVLLAWLDSSILRFYAEYDKKRQLEGFFSTVWKLSLISVAVLGFAWVAGILFLKPYISGQLSKLFSFGIPLFALFSLSRILLAVLKSERRVKAYSIFSVVDYSASIILGLVLITAFGLGIEGLLLGGIIVLILILPFLWKTAFGGYKIKKGGFSGTLVRKMRGYGLPLLITALFAWAIGFSDRYLIGLFKTAEEVGIYSANYNICAALMSVAIFLFSQADKPLGMQLWERKGAEKSREFLYLLVKLYVFICAPLALALGILSRPLTGIVLGKGYRSGHIIFPFIAAGLFFEGLGARFNLGLMFAKKTYFIMFSTVSAGIINVVLNVMLIPTYGYRGAAYATLVSYISYFLLCLFFSRKFFVNTLLPEGG